MKVVLVQSPKAKGSAGVLGPSYQPKQAKMDDSVGGKCSGGLLDQ
jgi:hypothetical protein